ncbi:MAG TPA: GNAT family N-acetyltransferase [Coriobacteriia bacterium]|nr:GNAT family N-acetyltransferase [Coriobacteriia bacterium]
MTVRGGESSAFEVREIEPGTPEYAQAADVRYEALYRASGLPRSVIEDTQGRRYRHVGVFDGGALVGYARIWLEGGGSRIFQVSVAPSRQGEGIGTLLVAELERIAAASGREAVELHARSHVVPFYERLGFVAEGEEFISGRAHTPHRYMRKRLGRV